MKAPIDLLAVSRLGDVFFVRDGSGRLWRCGIGVPAGAQGLTAPAIDRAIAIGDLVRVDESLPDWAAVENAVAGVIARHTTDAPAPSPAALGRAEAASVVRVARRLLGRGETASAKGMLETVLCSPVILQAPELHRSAAELMLAFKRLEAEQRGVEGHAEHVSGSDWDRVWGQNSLLSKSPA